MEWLKKSILVYLIIVNINSIQSQHLIVGGTINLGLSRVTSKARISSHSNTKFTLSGNFGMSLEKKAGSKSSLGLEFLWVQIEGKETSGETALIGQTLEMIGVISEEFRIQANYFGTPVYYRFTSGKIGIKLGIQPMILLSASSDYRASGEQNNEPFKYRHNTRNRKFSRVEIGPKLGVDYKLSNLLNLRVDYFHGLTDITSNESRGERKNRQITLGIQYTFDNLEE